MEIHVSDRYADDFEVYLYGRKIKYVISAIDGDGDYDDCVERNGYVQFYVTGDDGKLIYRHNRKEFVTAEACGVVEILKKGEKPSYDCLQGRAED